ncbi:hypothetical protein L211DRAFT_840303 [Terfezia boudieri ATCC MYA-4762]|uniref:Uncharacterized protein n=1 Tax=Terfezia boudieri ATCC MYA-4762 TaxID=1051890 RepID=A0A3N4LGE0_9PEZI|nr:hypothetical protein L211DRAFT_840303 [Terfezia boudieri ATCC MYA-4762]
MPFQVCFLASWVAIHFLIVFNTHVCVRGFGWVVMDYKLWVVSRALDLARVGKYELKPVVNVG